jgi:hypothetical protein
LKIPKTLSVSSLSMFEKQPYTFYLTRMDENPIPKEPQGLAAGMGSAFDAFIKVFLTEKIESLDLKEINKRILSGVYNEDEKVRLEKVNPNLISFEAGVEEQNRALVMNSALVLADKYLKSSFGQGTEWVDLEKHIHFMLQPRVDLAIPLFMRLDAVVNLKDYKNIPLDWKVKGFGSLTGASPTPGYCSGFKENGELLPPHALWEKDISMDAIDITWASQLCTYGWGLGHPLGSPFKGIIDCLVYRPTGWRFFRYEGWLTEEFQRSLILRFSNCWEKLKSGEFVHSLVKIRDVQEYLASQESWF